MIKPSGGQMLFRLLGTLEAWTGQDWAQIHAAKWRSVLATLLLHPGQPVATDVLIDELWPDGPPAKAGNLVSVYVHRLRRLIGDAKGGVLVTRAPGYQVVLGPGGLDSDRFAQLVADGRQALADEPLRAVELVTEALGLWRGRPLADVAATQLIAAEADRLEELRIEALALRADASLAAGRPSQVVAELRQLVADRPLQEKLWGLLMRALYGAGRQAEALEVFDQARTKISDELGVDPGAELRQLHQLILNDDASQLVSPLAQPAPWPVTVAAPPAPAQLPTDIADFTGRTGQVEQLRELLVGPGAEASPGAVRVVLIVGSGGLGKSTLAVHAAHLLASQFSDGQLHANLLGATQPAEPAEILARFLRDMGMDGARIPLGEEERAAHYRTRLAGKRMLIVLDDARDAAQVRPLLPGSASCAVLVTARGSLPELVESRVIDLDVLPRREARVLFRRVAGKMAAAEPDATEDVLAACAGLPLAIRIAGARLARRGGGTVRALADRLSDERRRLDVLRVGNLAVRASFEVSFATLPSPAAPGKLDPAQAFRLLGLWTGPSIGLIACSALLGEPEEAVLSALDVLVDAHLLETPEPDEYRFHDLLRVYAAEGALAQETAADRHDAIARVLAWYLHTAEAAARVISTQRREVPLDPLPSSVHPVEFGSLDMAIAWFENNRAGLMAATRLAASAGLHDVAWQLPAATMIFYNRRSHWADWVAAHEIGLASARVSGDRLAEARMLNNLGMAYGVQRGAESVEYIEQALALSRELGDGPGEAQAATNLAMAHFQLGNVNEARAAAQRSIEIERRVGDRFGEGIGLGILGGACQELGEFSQAIVFVNQALAIARGLGDRDFEAESLADLGEAHLGLGQVEDATRHLEESLAIRESIGDRYGQAATLRKLGRAHASAGNTGKARELLAQAIALYEDLGDHAQAAEVHGVLGTMH